MRCQADIIIQKQVEGKEEIDWRRNLAFTGFGCCFLGLFQWAVYVKGFSKIFKGMEKFCNQPLREKLKNRAGIKELFQQIGLDFLFIQPVIYWPVFYAFKESMNHMGLADDPPSAVSAVAGETTGPAGDHEKATPPGEAVPCATAVAAAGDAAEAGAATGIWAGALAKYGANFWEDNLGMCAFWLPADIVIYSVPLWMRLPLNHAISFGWVCVVSFMRGDA
jgi:hypothetical protein